MEKVTIKLTLPQLLRFRNLADKEIKAANRTDNFAYQAESYELKATILYALHYALHNANKD